jgi:hypothetical protein
VPRALALLNSIQRSVVSYPGSIPNIEFSVCLGDWPGDGETRWPIWVLTRRYDEEDKWVMPDFGYWSWPIDVIGEYSQVRTDILENEPDWKDKIPKAVWRGATATNQLREKLVEESEGKEWSDVHKISWENRTHMALGMDELSLSMPEHCDYQYVIHTEGMLSLTLLDNVHELTRTQGTPILAAENISLTALLCPLSTKLSGLSLTPTSSKPPGQTKISLRYRVISKT